MDHTDTSLVDLAEAPFTWKTLTAIANTEFVPKAYRGQPDRMLGAILYGRENGLGPMTSMQMIDMVDGKPAMSTELMVSLVRRAGHSIAIDELTSKTCTVRGTRGDTGDTITFTFTMEDAERAKLAGKGAWATYPHAMLWNRAASQLIRMLFPDTLISMHHYTPEELGAELTPTEAADGYADAVAQLSGGGAVSTSQSPAPPPEPPDEPLEAELFDGDES